MRPPFLFYVDLSVRSYEIDSFGHVNNAVYLHWLEQARWEMGQRSDLNWTGQDILPVVRHLTLDYQNETVVGDQLRICMWPRSVGHTNFIMGSCIRLIGATKNPAERCGKVVLLARQVLVCVRRGEGKVAVPDAWRKVFPATDPGEDFIPH